MLKHFYDFSGHSISMRKSNIYFSKGTRVAIRTKIKQVFGFQIVHNLGTYLGVPLLHERLTESTLTFVVDKVRRKLQNWKPRKLSILGRVTLTQSILLTIPNYFLQSIFIPKSICDEIEQIAR